MCVRFKRCSSRAIALAIAFRSAWGKLSFSFFATGGQIPATSRIHGSLFIFKHTLFNRVLSGEHYAYVWNSYSD
jgi:hypothetical protein